MTEKSSLAQQAAAVRRAAINRNGHVNNLQDLVARGLRPQHELDAAAQELPALLAAADTMERFAEQGINTASAAQAAAVRRAAIDHKAHVNKLQDLVARGLRPQHELHIAAQWLPALMAAADTMEALAAEADRAA